MSDKYPGGFVTANAPAGFSVNFNGSSGFSYSGTTFGSGAWTAELWFYFTGTSFTGPIQFFEGTTNSLVLAIMSSTTIRVDQVNVSNDLYTVPTMSANTWYHVAATKDASGNQTLFLNGVRSSTGVTTTSRNFSAATTRVAYSTIGGTNFTGYYSNLRFVTGTAVYNPLSTTINVPTQLFPVSGTSLLTCQSPTIIDNSSNAFAITTSGTPTVSNFTPFAAFSGSLVPRTSPQTASGVWTIDEAAYFTTQGLWPTAPDVPQKSLRFNSADGAYLNRTPASVGNRKTFTISTWCKKSAIEGTGNIINARSGSPWTVLAFSTGDGVGSAESLSFAVTAGVSSGVYTTGVFRDVGAWYHVVCAVDTTQATASNRVKIYINGVQQTLISGNYPTQNQDSEINNTVAHQIGNPTAYSNASNFYLTEFYLVDGQQLDPTAFGAFEGGTGVWSPAPYSGTYGTNGFYLRFFDNSNTTAATLGKDSSPNGNNWTPNNFSVTAGVGNDSLLDTPNRFGTDTGVGGQVGGNYATWNRTSPSGATFTNGNLDIATVNNGVITPSTIFQSSGKWYCEVLWVSGSNPRVGITNQAGLTSGLGNTTNSWANLLDGRLYHNASVTNYGVSLAAGDVLIMALDLDAGKLWYGKNGTWMASGDPATGANPSQTFTANQEMSFAVADGGGTPAFTGNFGQRPFAYTAPSGFKALVTTNLPTPAVGASNATLASKNMNVALYTGNGTSSATTQAITGVGFQPDLVWIKNRASAAYHVLTDAVRGTTAILSSNATDTEAAFDASWRSSYGQLTAFGSDGFTVAAGSVAGGNFNYSGQTYVGWAFKGGGTAVTNTSGTISSQVSANTTAGIAVVTYTGNGTSGATVGHGIGSAPAMIIIKRRSAIENWCTYHKSLGATKAVFLNLTDAQNTNSIFFNNTEPTSSVFSIGNNTSVNASSSTYVAYCFAEVAGFSKFGSYTGNGSADGPFVYCGFRPRYVMIKRTDAAGDWWVIDTARSSYNVATQYLIANTAAAEGSDNAIDILSNGFKLRVATFQPNTSGGTFIFMAFAEAPFNYSRAR